MVETGKPIQLKRDVEAIEIPAGFKVVLPVGSEVVVQQTLGGNFTVVTGWGHMLRIAGRDADALGATNAATEQRKADKFDEKLVWDELRTVFDPEIPVNVVDLGLIYECKSTLLPSGSYRVAVKMTITAPGCGMGEILKSEVYSKVAALPQVSEVDVQMVFDPPWNPDKMSEGAKLQLGFM